MAVKPRPKDTPKKKHRALKVLAFPPRDVPTQPIAKTAMQTQDCARCAHFSNCWDGSQSKKIVAINLLVCRMKNQEGRVREHATAAFIEAISPGLHKQVEAARAKAPNLSREELLRSLTNDAVDKIFHTYQISQIGYPLHLLFGPRIGAIYWAGVELSKRENDPRKRSLDDLPEEAYDWSAESEVDTARQENPGAKARAWARDWLPPLQWRMYAAMLQGLTESGRMPSVAAVARALRLDKRKANEAWQGACKALRAYGEKDKDRTASASRRA